MEFYKIIDELKKEIEVIEKELQKENKELEFFDNMFANYRKSGITGLTNLKYSDIYLAYALNNKNGFDFDFLSKKVETFKDIIDETSRSDWDHIIDTTILYKEGIGTKRLSKRLKPFRLGLNPLSIDFVQALTLKLIARKVKGPNKNIYNLVELSNYIPSIYEEVGKVVYIYKAFKNVKEDQYNQLDALENMFGFSMSSKKRNQMVNKSLKSNINIKGIESLMGDVISYKNEVISEDKRKKKLLNRQKSNNEELIEQLEKAFTSDKIIKNYKDLLKLTTSESIKKDILKEVYKHNETLYEEINRVHDKLSNNTALKFKSVLRENGIDVESVNINEIKIDDVNDLDEILKLITTFEYTDKSNLIEVIENTDKNHIKAIDELLKQGVITSKFIKNNYEVLLPSDTHNNLISNVNLLNSKTINPMLLEDSEVLLEPTKVFGSGIKTLEEYNYLEFIKNANNYEFLRNDNLPEVIDEYLELGLENELENNLNLLNTDNIKRLELLKELGLLEENKSNIEEILNKDTFIVPDDNIDKYIINKELYTSNIDIIDENLNFEIEELKEYDNGRTYLINGELYSKNRVKRNYKNIIEKDNDTKIYLSLISNKYEKPQNIGKIKELTNKKD